MSEKATFVLSTSKEIFETAEEFNLTECSECGEELKLEKKTDKLVHKLRDFIGKPKYETNIANISSFPNEEPEATCVDCRL